MRMLTAVAACACLAAVLAGTAVAAEDYVMIGKDKLWNAPRPDGPDLSVQYISRTPRYPGQKPEYRQVNDPVIGQGDALPPKILNKGAQGWPKDGQEVTFTAVVRNVGTEPVERFDWHWLYDGKEVEHGWHEQTLRPDETVEFELQRPWESGRHAIAFEVDRPRLIDETCEENNWVIDRTDALSMAFFVEESVHEYFKTIRNGLGSYDWADWGQFQIRQMNKEYRDTIYPTCPDGIEERVRLDRVYIIPDGWGHKGGMHTPGLVMPADVNDPQFYNANEPPEGVELQVFDNVHGGVDGVWGFTVDLLKKNEQTGKAFYDGQPRWVTGSEWPLHHELGHQLGRADHYLIWSDKNENPVVPGLGYAPPKDYQDGMMHHGNYSHDNAIGKNTQKWDSTYRFYSEHTARSFNRDKGERRGLFGEYFVDIPTNNTFLFVGADGEPVGAGDVAIYVGRGRGYTGCGFNERPNFTGEVGADGKYTLDRSPWKVVFNWGSNGVVMFAVTPEDGEPMVGFLDLSHFNLAYWRGHEDDAEYIVKMQEIEE